MDYLDFIILKINGMDVSKSPHADAVREFMAADEPIVVEVVRRISKTSPNITSCSSASSISTDLKETNSDFEMLTSFNHDKNEISTSSGVVYSNAKDLDVDEAHSNDQSKQQLELVSNGSKEDEEDDEEEEEDDDEDEEDADGDEDDNEIIYENGCIFRKYVQCDCCSCNENDGEVDVGSKLISRSVQTNITAINWVDELDEYLLHVNLEDLLAQKSTSSNSSTSDSTRNGNGIGNASQTDEHFHETTYSPNIHQDIDLMSGRKKSDATCSHVGDYTSEQTSNDIMLTKSPTDSFIRTQLDNINEQIALLDHRMNRIKLINHRSKKEPPKKPVVDIEHIYETIQDSEAEPIYSSPYEPDVGSNSYGSKGVEEVSKMGTDAGTSHQPSFTFKLDCKSHTSRSILKLCPVSGDWSHPGGSQDRTQRSGEKYHNSKSSKMQQNTTGIIAHSCKNRRRIPLQIPADTMYTNIANLHQTIMLQQQLFRQALDQRNQTILHSATTAQSNNNKSSIQKITSERTVQKDHFLQMEWKVKRRQNGTRYITQRPIRNKILRNRAKEILEAQADMTTEDDASVIKLGRYWTREERKLHMLEREKRLKSSTLSSGQWKSDGKQHRISSTTLTNVKISRENPGKLVPKKVVVNDKKALKKKHKDPEPTDDFKTVQEMIINGNRTTTRPNGKMIGLLSVTTV